MVLDLKKLDEPLIKLRKLVRNLSKVPTQNEVHDIRTNTRRVEATLEALQLRRTRKGRRVLLAITPIRKKAGDVRDMDVLTSFSATLSSDHDDQCLVRLLEHLGEERAHAASKLRKTVAKHRKVARKSLKACSSWIKKNLDNRSAKMQTEWPADAVATVFRVSGELTSWPRLSTDSLHPFRLKVKEMRYVLQLSGQDDELTERLGEVKDQIGKWHDWTELDAIAKKVLSECKNCSLATQIEQTAKRKFAVALATAQQLRSQYFEPQGGRQNRSRRKPALSEPALKTTARLAA